ncbi:MAG: DUF3396 domain-containing protein [Mesorhizobium sp.]|nr:DUF3396 domain-containing protein [Mesorhizobium sp. M5C.F.Cr.IN.023.01.1.1]RWF82281.1 MAG: DUF3396 domain-containing protein [Mesorhizobium sp.]RWF95780.1 MAG: DUF3396 domain-containing protein [Mesorhizobium sp.]RWI38141.1 MAG: DUF3396 domain-containing protein [Mesorhizobium sp.]RWI46121.1 MAG: DUF3396 domain-containing protein [Mesorhizobium sp.]
MERRLPTAARTMNSAAEFPPALLKSDVINGRPLNKILLELVVYPKDLTVAQFDWVLDLYSAVCPRDRIKLFQIPELQVWSEVATPYLTQSARSAQADGRRYAYFEAARRRIQEHRAVEARLWDGCEIEDEGGSFALNIQGLKYKSRETCWYIRFLFPLSFPPDQLTSLARTVADRIDLYSGHGGPVFAYFPDSRRQAFTEIYAKARRFWGVDIDMLDFVAQRMRRELKSPCWLNLLGSPFRTDADLLGRMHALRAEHDISIYDQVFGTVFVLGKEPSGLDRNRLAKDVRLYQAMAKVMDGHILEGVDPLPGDGFLANADATDDWLHRFSPGSDWPVLRNLQ